MPALWILAIAMVAVVAIAGSSHVRAERKSVRASASQVRPTAAQDSRVRANLAALPLAFEANQGQTDPEVKYMARGNGYKLFLTSSKAIMSLPGGKRQSEVMDMMMNKRRGAAGVKAMMKRRAGMRKKVSPATLQMNFLGGNAHPQLIAEDLQSGKVNYFIGKDRSKWHSNIPLYGRVNYRNLYPGVDLAFHGASRQLEFDYVVNPGADPKTVALTLDGADAVRTNEAGDLILA